MQIFPPLYASSFLSLLILLTAAPRASAGAPRADDLRDFTTRHYHVHTDLDPELSDDLCRRLDGMYDEYARRLADFPRPNDSAPLEAYLVRSEERYLHIAGLTLKGTGGSFNARRRLLAAFLDGQGRDALRRTLQHEAFHQFAADAVGPDLPVWLNEGLAQVFEEGIWTGDGFALGQVPPRRLMQLRSDIDSRMLIDFPALLETTPQQWAANWRDTARSATQYNQSWAMTHFLIYATDSSGQPRFRARLIEMLKLLRQGRDAGTAFKAAFSPNIAGFRDRFLEYAATLQATPEATLIEHEGVLADLLVELKSRGQTFVTIDEFRAACLTEGWQMHYRRGDLQWTSDRDNAVYFRTPRGEAFPPGEQSFSSALRSPLPDLVCRYDDRTQLRTRFSEAVGKIEHETLVESADAR